MNDRLMKYPFYFILGILIFGIFIQWGCKPENGGELVPNQPPVVHLANVPQDDSTTIADSVTSPRKSPLVRLYWVGNDADGFVTGFMYRWSFNDSSASGVVRYRPWTVVLNYVPFSNRILILHLDTIDVFNTASHVVPSLFKYFANIDADPERREESSPLYDTSLVNTFKRIDNGDTVTIQGIRIYASNPEANAYPIHESQNSGYFTFESNERVNLHKFEIRAVDNEGAISDVDSVRFWTPQVAYPELAYTTAAGSFPSQNDTTYVLFNPTYTWFGIRFTFKAQDRNSRTWRYSWKTDNRDWSEWTLPTGSAVTAVITASQLDTPYTRLDTANNFHTFTVRAENEFGVRNLPSPALTKKFLTIFPDIAIPGTPKKILVINMSNKPSPFTEPPAESLFYPTPRQMNVFFKELLDSTFGGDTNKYTFWDMSRSIGISGANHPSLGTLGKYSSVIILQDNFRSAPPRSNQIQALPYTKYLAIGGNLLMDGVNWWVILQVVDVPNALLSNYMSILGFGAFDGYFIDRDTSFTGAYGARGYPNISLDPNKMKPVWGGALNNLSTVLPKGFGEKIYFFKSKNGGFPEGESMGVRYLGATYQTVYLGFPLYYVEKSTAIEVMKKAMRDLGQF